MDFILVPDALFASEARYALARHNSVGTRVGSFKVLLETLLELWVLPPADDSLQDPWEDVLQQQALAMTDVFWAESIKADERGTLRAISASLQLALDYCPLGGSLQPITAAGGAELSRQQRYYNDLVRLQLAISERPMLQQQAEQWLKESEGPALEPLHLYPLYREGAFSEQDLLPWQRSVLNRLQEKGWLNPHGERYIEVFATLYRTEQHADNQANNPISQLAQTLFSQPAEPLDNPADHIQWLVCRDAVEEAEAASVQIQQAVDSGTPVEDIAVVVPQGTDHGRWLGHYLQRAGISASYLRPAANQFDWQTALLQNLLAYRVNPDVRMAMQSVFINPLMPWGAVTGYRLAAKYADYDMLENEPESRQALIQLLLRPTEPETAEGLMQWLNNISERLSHRGVIGLGKSRQQQLLQQIQRLLAMYDDLPFADQLRSVLQNLNVGSLTLNGERTRYLNAVLVLEEGEPLPVTVQQLYVLGFNSGHYQYQSGYTGALNRKQWDDLELPQLPRQSEEQQRWQEGFRQLLSNVSSKLIFMRSLADADGKRLDPSDTLIDMALCYCPIDKLKPENLEQPLAAVAGIWHDIAPTRSTELPQATHIELGQSLLGIFKTRNGNERPESPSSLEKMMLSPLAWLLSRLYIEPEQWEIDSDNPRLAGIVAHQVFEDYRQYQHTIWNTADAEHWVEQAITRHAPFLHGAKFVLQKQQLRNDVVTALQALQQWLQQEGWEITATEQELSGTIPNLSGITVRGKTDAVLTNKQGDVLILDYKNSGHKKRLQQLEKGYELQTCLYRELYQRQQQPDGVVGSAYYTLKDQTLVAGTAITRGEQVNTVNPGDKGMAEQSEQAEERLQSTLQKLKDGSIALNSSDDEKHWQKRGLSTYVLKENRLVQRFTLADSNHDEADA